MTFDTKKLLMLKGSAAARAPKVGDVEPPAPAQLGGDTLMVLKGADVARTNKVGSLPAPVMPTKS